MKHTRKMLSILLALVMAFALATTALATEEAETYTITAPDNGHTYEVYQIFTGDLNAGVLSNVKWGKNGTGIQGEAVPDTILTELEGTTGSDTDKLAVITKYVDLSGAPYATVGDIDKPETEEESERVESVKVPAGYYLIKDKANSVSGEDSYTLYIVNIVGNVTISPKSEVPSFEKKLKDTNDTTGETSDWQDSADWDIGDKIPFQLKGTVASDYDSYKTYYFAFHDVEEAGLTFDSTSVKVYVDGTPIENGYEVVTNPADSCTFEVIFKDLKNITSVHASSVITVEYESSLNSSANLGDQGNVNKAKLEFSNNPNEEQSGELWTKPETGETPWDNVIVFTYKTIINKVEPTTKTITVDEYNALSDSEKQNCTPVTSGDDTETPVNYTYKTTKSLTGAEFKLEKKVLKTPANEEENTDAVYEWVTIAVVKSEDGTTFTFSGLDDGEYLLTETTTPSGYNTIDPITFTVTANHTITWDGENRTKVLTSLSGDKVSGEITFTSNTTEGSLSADVVNNAGSTLPETGGIGTTIFYVLGSVLVIGAVVLLVTKKRMRDNA